MPYQKAFVKSVIITFEDPTDGSQDVVVLDDVPGSAIGSQARFAQNTSSHYYSYGYDFLQQVSRILYWMTDYNRRAQLK